MNELIWRMYNTKKHALFMYGIKNGLIKIYDEEFLSDLRDIYYGFLPISVLLLENDFCDGNCYEIAPLVTLGMKDNNYKIVNATVNSLKLNPKLINEYKMGFRDELYSEHCYAVMTDNSGVSWVFDTSLGLIFEEELYKRIENPIERVVNDKEKTIKYLSDTLTNNIDSDKYLLPTMLPMLENDLKPIQPFYLDLLKNEIDIFKKNIKYDDIYQKTLHFM